MAARRPLVRVGGEIAQLPQGDSVEGLAISWGLITGDLADQIDLSSALDGKLGSTATAADSTMLGGQPPAYYATAADIGDIGGALDIINGEVV